MILILESSLVAVLHTTLSVLVPGLLLNRLIFWKPTKGEFIEEAIQSAMLGYFYNSFQFLAIYALVSSETIRASQTALVGVKYLADLSMLLYLACRRPDIIRDFVRGLVAFFRHREHAVIALVSVATGLVAVMYYPHVLDSSQLLWTRRLTDGAMPAISSSTGAFGYSALIYFPGVVVAHIPLVTLAAGFKLVLPMLLALAVVYLTSRVQFSDGKVAAMTYLVIILLSYLGLYGIIQLGKDSVLAVIISMCYMASLMSMSLDDTAYMRAALLFACSVISGVITAPYLVLLTCIYLVLAIGTIRPWAFLFWLLTFSSVGFGVASHAMLGTPITPVRIGAMVLAATTFYLLRQKRIMRGVSSRVEALSRVASALSIPLLLAAGVALMPVRVGVVPWSDAQGNPIVEYRAPLDGKMPFREFLFHFEPLLLRATVLLGLVGMVACAMNGRFSNNRGLRAMALFPLSMVVFVLILTHMGDSLFSGFNLWDMLRDVPLWYGAIFFGLFAMVGMDVMVGSLLREPMRKVAFRICCGLLVVASLAANGAAIVAQVKELPRFTRSGGNKDAYFAELADVLVRNKRTARWLYVARSARAFSMFYSFQMYTDAQVVPVSMAMEKDMVAMLGNLPVMLAVKEDQLRSVDRSYGGRSVKITTLYYYPQAREGLYLLE